MMEEAKKKRERGANYTPEEKTALADLVLQYKHTIEDNRTGGMFMAKKGDMAIISQQLMDVIVIGCGASGIAALRKLHDAGLKVMGLEAADRIGGRIRTVEFGGGVVDIGAAWCHGEKDNIVFELCNPLDLLGRPDPDQTWFLLSNGEVVDAATGEQMQKTLGDIVANANKDNAMSIEQCVRETAEATPSLQQSPLTNPFIEWFLRNNHVGGQTDATGGKSLRGVREAWPCEGEFWLNWRGRGYATVLDVLLNRYPDQSAEIPVPIHTNKDVETIKWKASLPGFDADPLVQIKCKDGSLFAARSVIVTCSVGVLKDRCHQLFNPPLPQYKLNTINNLQMAILDKIYIEFTSPWWPKHPACFTILWREQEKQKFSKDESWITEIYGLNTVEYQPNTLLAWIYGQGAEKVETISVEGVRAGVEKLLDSVFRKNFKVTPVKSVLRSQWASNAYARGAYAYRSIANERDGGDATALAEPLRHTDDFPVVCFAGEATSIHHHSGVHGAVEAGFREAERLIDNFAKREKK